MTRPTASELIARRPARPPFDIRRAAYAELHVTDLAASERWYVEALGLVPSLRTDDALYLRGWEERPHHSLVLRQAPVAAVARLALRVGGDEDLTALESEFKGRGCTTRWSDGDVATGRTLLAWDPFGFPLAFFAEMERFDTQLQRFDLHRGAPIMRLDHFNIHSPEVEQALAFWLELGFRCTEYISTDDPRDERVTGAWLARKPTVHDIALTAGRGPRLHHIGLGCAEASGVMRACDQLAAAGYAHSIERGPGRHGVSNAFFVYLRDPDGHRIELYACDYYTGDPDHAPLRWSVSDARCRSFWGTRAPDSWYTESSLLLGPDGAPLQTTEADVDERDARTEVMA